MAQDSKVENRARTGASTWPEFRPGSRLRGLWGVAWPGSEFAVPARLRQWAALEVGAGRLLPWFAVAYGTGIVLYFTAEREPAWWAALALAALVAAIAFAARRSRFGFPSALTFAAAAAGFAVATLHTAWIAHPVLRRATWNVAVSGFIESREERERNDRIVVHAHTIEGRRLDPVPQRVRVTVRTGTAPAVGSFVAFKADLLPPLAPLRPGGYDFARDMYFSAHRRLRLRARPHQQRGAASQTPAPGCVTPRPSRACATPSTSASAPSFPATRAQSPRR